MTLGEPAGIGPDITLAVWRRRAELDLPPFYLVADPDFLRAARARSASTCRSAVVAPAQAAAAFARALPVVPLDMPSHRRARQARRDQRAGGDRLDPPRGRRRAGRRAAAIVTNPVAKNVLYRSGFAEPGHTEFLAKLAAGSDRTSRCIR